MQNDPGNDVIDLTRPATPPSAPSRWRTRLAIGLALAFIVVCTGLTLSYRDAHRNVWTKGQAPWRGFDVSADGRTLTFNVTEMSSCARITGVDFSSDPTEGGELLATVRTKQETLRDGHPVFCNLSFSINGTSFPVRLDRPVPDGTVITDGAMYPLTCGRRSVQEVHTPTFIAPAWAGCTAAG